jgi:hypothetical protein
MAIVGEEVEPAARALIGRTLEGVRYYSLPYGMTDRPNWDHEVAHVADYGVDLIASGTTTGLTWVQYGNFGYGLRVLNEPVLSTVRRGEFASVDESEPWTDRIGAEIASVEVHWFVVTVGDTEITAPTALSLRFRNVAPIALICVSWNGSEGSVFPTGDDIVVVWKPETVHTLVPYLDSRLLDP